MFDDSSWLTKSQEEEEEEEKGVEEEVGGPQMEVSRCCWRVISAKVCPSQGTHTHTQQSKLKPKNETAAGNVDSAGQS